MLAEAFENWAEHFQRSRQVDALLQQRDSIAAAVSEAKAQVGTVFAQDKPPGLDLPQWQSRQSLAAAQLQAAATSLSMYSEVGIRCCA